MDNTKRENPFGLGQQRDIWSRVRWKVEGVGPERVISFGLPEGTTKESAFAEMDGMKIKHPDLTMWAVLKFEKWIHVTQEERDA